MLGWAMALSTRWRSVMSIGTICASAVSERVLVPSKRVHRRPSSCRSRSATSVATRSIERRRRGERLLFGEGAALVDGCLRERHVPVPSGRQRARVGGQVLPPPSSPWSRPSSGRCPSTGWAAPMWVPGAIAATSAAMVRMKPADAARAPDGSDEHRDRRRAASMRVTMSRVESTRPPGVRSVKTTSAAPAWSARSMSGSCIRRKQDG